MSERGASVADGMTVCWAVIFTVWCAATGHMTWWLMSTGPLVGAYITVNVLGSARRRKERDKS